MDALAGSLAVRRSKPAVDVWEGLADHVDPVKQRPKLADDIEVRRFKTRWGMEYAMIANPRDLVHFKLDPSELQLLDLMDGSRTVEEIVLERMRESGDLEAGFVADLVTTLREENFFDERFQNVEASLNRTLHPPTIGTRAVRLLKELSVDWFGAYRFVRWLYEHGLKHVFRPVALVFSTLLALFGFAVFLQTVHAKTFSFSSDKLALEGLVILGLNLFLTFVHELGHALVIVRHGRKMKSAGVMIYFGTPAFFVDASDGLMMSRHQRMVQAFAGPYAQAVVAGIAAIIAWAYPHGGLSQVLYKVAVLNYLMVFFNLLPMLELDGYHILSEAVDVPDLRPRSLAFVRHDFLRKIRTRERLTKTDWGLLAFGVIGVAFVVFSYYTSIFFWRNIFGGLVRSMWRGGTTGRVILIVLGVVLFGPVIRGLISLGRVLYRRGVSVWRNIKFKLETSWRIEAGELIDALPIFEDLDEDALSDLAGRVKLRSIRRGQSVVRQGERALAFYVIRRGTFHVIEEDKETGAERLMRVMGRGEGFGELAVAQAATRRATVRAVEDAEVFEIGKSDFDRLLVDRLNMPDLAPTLEDAAELRELSCFSHLEQDELVELLRYGSWMTVAPGESVVAKGAVADTFYAIRSGQFDVLDGRKVVASLGAGQYFGEVGLLLNVRRTATVRARTAGRLYRLNRTGFNRLVRDAFKRGTLDTSGIVGPQRESRRR